MRVVMTGLKIRDSEKHAPRLTCRVLAFDESPSANPGLAVASA